MDYILFLTADVDVTPNANEIRDHKYVSKAELQAMFEDPGACSLSNLGDHANILCSELLHTLVQAYCP